MEVKLSRVLSEETRECQDSGLLETALIHVPMLYAEVSVSNTELLSTLICKQTECNICQLQHHQTPMLVVEPIYHQRHII